MNTHLILINTHGLRKASLIHDDLDFQIVNTEVFLSGQEII